MSLFVFSLATMEKPVERVLATTAHLREQRLAIKPALFLSLQLFSICKKRRINELALDLEKG
jgi:hypothetical protein